MSRRWRLIVALAVLLTGIAPVLSVVIAGALASAHGCTLHEGFVNPCVILGKDRGETLYTMAVAGWFALVTLPLAALAALALAIEGVAALVRRLRR
ncbi:hypothetical protein [Frigidibacter oleivorans]|uniref:hypothetical protein n=1 Tax=Frigidibacter oleivorans TaxID=2487129 RepID=UPI000F8DB36F|nr:hypothetical protein [Frigidibacter oleivorans]